MKAIKILLVVLLTSLFLFIGLAVQGLLAFINFSNPYKFETFTTIQWVFQILWVIIWIAGGLIVSIGVVRDPNFEKDFK